MGCLDAELKKYRDQMSKMRDGPAKNAVKQGGKAKIGEREIDLKKVTPKSDSYFGAGYSDFYGYDSAVQTEEKKVRNRQVRICQLKMQKE